MQMKLHNTVRKPEFTDPFYENCNYWHVYSHSVVCSCIASLVAAITKISLGLLQKN